MQLSIALPCFNEEENLPATIADVHGWMEKRDIAGEIIAVNDGSKDGTGRVLEELKKSHPRLRIVTHPENRGYGAAVRSGCDAAQTEWIGFMDSDGQFKAEDFDKLIPFCEKNSFIVGRRRKRADPFLRKVNAKCFGFLTWIVFRVWVRDLNCAMKVFRRDLWQRIRPVHATGALFNAELFVRARKAGVRWQQVDVTHYPRTKGMQTGASPLVILRMFKELWMLWRSLP
ncbi:MAG: glycosyltransferase family 2 protein [Patescibacteria group bacterium]